MFIYLWQFCFTTAFACILVSAIYAIYPFNTFFLDKVLLYVGITPTTDHILLLFTGILVQIYVLLCALPPFQRIILWLEGCRKLDDSMAEYLEKVKEIIEKESSMDLSSYHFYHKSSLEENMFALGRRHIVIYSPFFTRLYTPRETAAVICHELGHLNLYHTTFSLGVSFLASLSYILIQLYTLIANIIMFFVRFIPYIGSLINLMVFFIHLFIALYYMIMNVIIYFFYLFSSRRDEYAADLYSAKAGFGEDLISALSKLDPHPSDLTKFQMVCEFVSNLKDSHPPTRKRINNIRKYLEKQKNSVA